jgi:hypothetical protein
MAKAKLAGKAFEEFAKQDQAVAEQKENKKDDTSKTELVKEETKAVTSVLDQSVYIAPIPEDRNVCISMILTSLKDIQRETVTRYWFIGKVIYGLEARNEEGIYEELEHKTGLKERTLRYCYTLFLKFEDFNYLKQLAGKVDWSHFKDIMKLKNEDNRKQLCDKLIKTDEIDNEKLDTSIDKALAAEKAKEDPKLKTEEDDEDIPELLGVFKELENTAALFMRDFRKQEDRLHDAVLLMINTEKISDAKFEKLKSPVDKLVTTFSAVVEQLTAEVAFINTQLKEDQQTS